MKISRNLLTAFILLLCSCSSSFKMSGELIIEKKSNDPNIVAVISRAGYGATTAWVYRVYVHDLNYPDFYEVLRADKLNNIDIVWKDDDLIIKMDCGRIFNYKNFSDIIDQKGNLKKRIPITLYETALCKS